MKRKYWYPITWLFSFCAAIAIGIAIGMASLARAQTRSACIVMGDSIAQGASAYAPECVALATKGISSQGWRKAYDGARLSAGKVLISLGTNDGDAKSTMESLAAIRSRVDASQVIWIAPGEQFAAREVVVKVALAFGDKIYERPVENLAADRIHFKPEGYARIGAAARP